MSAATQQKYPSKAEIVRQETDGGRRIVEFYLGVADGNLEGFEDRHRMSAARRLDKIAPGLVAEYLQKYYNSQCRDSLRGSLLPLVRRSPIKRNPPERSEQAPRGPSVFQRRLTQLVREETGDGKAIVDFMVGVMHGAITGFKPYHRLEAAKELASYVTPNDSTSSSRRSREGMSPTSRGREPIPGPSTQGMDSRRRGNDGTGSIRTPDNSTVVPEQSATGIQGGAVRRGSHPLPTKNSKPKTRNSPPISRQELEQANFDSHHIARYTFARDEITGAIYAFDGLGPLVLDEDGVPHSISPDRIAGYDHASLMSEHRTRPEPNSPVVPAKSLPRPQLETNNQELKTRRPRRDLDRKQHAEKPEPVGEPIPNLWERRMKEKLEQHWHEPDPLADSSPVFSTNPGRSPP